jgi:cell division septal protein FtsQ
MPEETKSKRKKKRKFGYYLYAVVIIVLTIVNITLATMLLTHVQDIKVVGNQLSDKQDVIAWIQEDKLTRNSLYTYFKFKAGVRKLPVYLEDVKVQLSAPWEVEVTVTEKKIIGSTILDEIYVYFDEEGLILKKVNEYDTTIPIIEGIEMKNAEVFEYMNVENEKVFSYIVKVTQEIQKKELHPDHIVWEDDSMNL